MTPMLKILKFDPPPKKFKKKKKEPMKIKNFLSYGYIFFLKKTFENFLALLATSLGEAQLALLLLFCRSGVLPGVSGLSKIYLSL